MTNNINDLHRYTQLMRNGFYDKLFFVDKLYNHWESLADFGCAEGFQTKIIAEVFPDKRIIGYDADEGMINLANYGGSKPGNVSFTSIVAGIFNADVIYLSSTLHEIYSYKDQSYIDAFWDVVFADRKYIIIRDMMYTYGDNINLSGNADAIVRYCSGVNAMGALLQHNERWGDIQISEKPMAQFLLKLPYLHSNNWSREINENYFSFDIQSLWKVMPSAYEITFEEHYVLPYMKWWWKKNLGIEISHKTHCKIIIEKK